MLSLKLLSANYALTLNSRDAYQHFQPILKYFLDIQQIV